MFSSSTLSIILQTDTLYTNTTYPVEDSSQMTLRGSVLLSVNSALKIKKLTLQFNGKLSMQFPAAIKKTRRDLVDETIVLLEHDKATSISGQHTFPFEILVPSDLPDTFRGKYGKIRYSLKAVAETPFINSDLKTEVPVQVRRDVNNMQEEITSENVVESHSEDKLACKVMLPTSEYTPGEKFDIQVSALPLDEAVSVTNVTCTLKECTYFHIPSKKDRNRVSVAEYMKHLSTASNSFSDEEHVKTLVMKTPEEASCSCINPLVEISHQLSVRVYWEADDGHKDSVMINVPINIVSFIGTPEFDQLPVYHTVELPPTYRAAISHSEDETVPISLPPCYCISG